MKNVIKISTHGIAITREKMPAIKAEIKEASQLGEPVILDFNGVKGLEVEAAKSLFDSLAVNHHKVMFTGAIPAVDAALSIGGRTVKQGEVVSPHRSTKYPKAFSVPRVITMLIMLLTLGVGQMWG